MNHQSACTRKGVLPKAQVHTAGIKEVGNFGMFLTKDDWKATGFCSVAQETIQDPVISPNGREHEKELHV